MRIAVIDGQGGGIGKTIVEKLRQCFDNQIDIIALGTNALATALMLKAGANEGASGENAIIYSVTKVDVILGTVGVIAANSMLGELTPLMAKAVAESSARKILIPLNKYNIQIAGAANEPLPHCIDNAIELVKNFMRGEKHV